MNKREIKMMLDSIEDLEKFLMRDLTNDEVEYLNNHSPEVFLEQLGFDYSNILMLNKIRELISNKCTNFVRYDYEGKLLFFDSDNTKRVKKVLESLLNLLDNDSKINNKLSERAIKGESGDCVKCNQSTFNEEQLTDECEIKDSDNKDEDPEIYKFFPNKERKWLYCLSIKTIYDFIDKAENDLKRAGSYKEEDVYQTALICIKDFIVDEYEKILIKGNPVYFSDIDLQNEVETILFERGYSLKSTNNKLEIICE